MVHAPLTGRPLRADRRLGAAALLAAAVVLALPLEGAAQTPACGSRDGILKQLARTHAESPINLGVTDEGGLLEVLTGPTGTWSMIITFPGGETCLVAQGDDWRNLGFPVATEKPSE